MHEQSLHGAARLSEDIGDVLSSIRRMIAEDDALAEARAERHHTRRLAMGKAPATAAPVHDTAARDSGEYLAARHGGNAALARRMAIPAASATASDPLDQDVPVDQAVSAPRALPDARGLRIAAQTAVPAAPVLRLGAAQRVTPDAHDSLPANTRTHSPWKLWSPPPSPAVETEQAMGDVTLPEIGATPPHMTPTALAESLARLGATEALVQPLAAAADWHDDLDEPFEAKARMRPDLPDSAPLTTPPQDSATARGDAQTADQPQQFDALYRDLTAQDAIATDQTEDRGDLAAAPQADDINDDDEAEQIIRDTIRDMIQEELHGELGMRFSRNLRAMIRREVAAAIEENLDRF